MQFTPSCTKCPRLAGFLAEVRRDYPNYHGLPVSPFGDNNPRLLIVGLAPGMHGANRTGRPFTGDHAGILLYQTLHRFGFSNQATGASRDDGLKLIGCRITNAVKCLPPQNKPETSEIIGCNDYLKQELNTIDKDCAVLALGNVAHTSVLRAMGLRAKDYAFGHAAQHVLPNGLKLYDSYHCSRYNTQTKRLTPAMFEAVFAAIKHRLEGA